MLSHATVSPDYLQVNQVEDLGLMPNLSEDITQLWFWDPLLFCRPLARGLLYSYVVVVRSLRWNHVKLLSSGRIVISSSNKSLVRSSASLSRRRNAFSILLAL